MRKSHNSVWHLMLPRAREQAGFQGALILRHPDKDQGIIITLWETEEALLASEAPEDIRPDVERLGELIVGESLQDIYDVFFRS